MRPSYEDIAIGALAGAATVMLSLGITTGSGLAILLFLFSPLPIMVAGFGWGVRAGVTGLIVSCAGVALIANLNSAGFVLLTTSLPAAMASLWLTLARPAEEIGGPRGQMAWFPLSDVIFRLAMMTACAFLIAGILTGYGEEFATLVADEMIARLREQNSEFAFTPEAREQFVASLKTMIPLTQPAMWLLVLVMNLYFALAIARRSGRLSRPEDSWPVSMRMPRVAAFILAVAIGATMIGGQISLAANTVIGALLAGFTISGFAVFHFNTSGKPWRPLAMFLAYGSVAMLVFPAFAFTAIGLFNLARNMPITPSNPTSGGTPPPAA